MSKRTGAAPKHKMPSLSRARFGSFTGRKPKLIKSNLNSLSGVFRSTTSANSSSRAVEIRCYKFSPRVQPMKGLISADLFEYEAMAWRAAFSTMGRLQELHLKEASPFTTLNKAPYHCPCLSRDFKVAYGKMSQVEGASVKGTFKPKKEIKVSFCNCIFSSNLPKIGESAKPDAIPQSLLTNKRRVFRPYLPKSTVIVKYNKEFYDVETICEWLQQSFGPFIFTIRKGGHTLIVSFEGMSAAYKAVNNPLPFARIVVSWLDPKMYNYGHFCTYKNYTIDGDTVWQRLLTQLILKEKGIMKAHTQGSTIKSLKFDT